MIHSCHRRLLLSLLPLGLAASGAALSQEALAPLNRFPRMMQEWLVDQTRTAEARGEARRAALKTKEDAEAYVRSVRERIRESFGPMPEKTPLNARVTGRVERDAYAIENVIFESRPGFPVTANLYLPKGKAGPFPGVIGTCGHSANGKAAETYQSFAQGLARQGYVCLIFDPPGQGERFQYLKEGFKSRYGPGVSEHVQAGNQMTLVGEFIGSWFAWDGIRALDYLLTRPEVDPKRVGLTGNSGGGTQATWLCGLEDRWSMAAPACFVTTFRRGVENELPQDTEQCPPRALALDLDHSDFLAALAPKPVIILAKEFDYFDARGSEEAHQRLRRLYALLGGEENHAALFIGPSYHGYTQDNREAMYRFFNGVTRVSDAQTEPEITIEKDETLWATPRGQLHLEGGARTLASFTSEKAGKLAETRAKLDAAGLKKAVREVLKLPAAEGVADYRILRHLGKRGYPAKGYCAYAVETEPRVFALVTRLYEDTLLSRPPRGRKRAVLYVSHRSADAELRGEPLVRELSAAEPDAAFYAMDVRGCGDSQPDICGKDFRNAYGSDYFLSAYSLMLDRPYLGQKTHDVLRVLDWLRAQGHEEIHLAGRGWGALPAAFAALLHDGVNRVTLKNALSSYQEVAQTEDYKWPYSMLPPNILARFDLPQVYDELKSRALRSIEPWGALDGMKE